MPTAPTMSAAPSPQLKGLEAESIEIIREAVAGARLPVMMYPIGKDPSVITNGLARRTSRASASVVQESRT
jgi:hypothetical protein